MIIGITGSFGAGKGAVVEYLTQTKDFQHFSASGFITEEIMRRELPVNRDSMILVANDLRANFGPGYIIDSLFERAKAKGGNVIIESLRAVAEVRRIKELGGIVIGIDSLPEIRYERSIGRNSVKDNVTYEKWLAQELTESNESDPNKQNIFGSLNESSVIFSNNASLQELYAQIDSFLTRVNH